MVRTPSGAPWPLLSALLVAGAIAACAAFWLVDQRGAVRDAGILIAILLGTYFVCWTWALIRYLRWRDSRRAVSGDIASYHPYLEGTVYGLVPGSEYRVMQSFTDCYGNQFEAGEVLRFKERYFLPYHGGHTIVFEGRPLYLQETRNEAILENFSEYIVRVER